MLRRASGLGLREREITGGAAAGALVAATAADHGAELVTCDRRIIRSPCAKLTVSVAS
jgi:predicted nucleic acid-binding protein